jgi:hypothetical protein
MIANLTSAGLAKTDDPNATFDRREADRVQPIPQIAQRNEPFLGIIPALVPIIDGASPIEIMRPVKREPALPGVALALGGIEFKSHSLV